MKRYVQLAEEIAAAIRAGVMVPGDRLPSVREASTSRGVSPSTVFKAYYLLEARGLVQARSKSGYFVLDAAVHRAPEPEAASRPSEEATTVDVSALVFEILQSAMDREVVPFGSAFPSPSLFPMQRLARALSASVHTLEPRNTLDDLLPGRADLRRQISLRYLLGGMDVPPDQIVVTNGALEALNLCLATVANPGDAVLVESPSFYAALQAIERSGLRAVEVPTHPREGIELGALAEAIERHRPAACWLMTNLQNPLGASMPEAKKRALVELLARHVIPLIEDDVYAELYFGKERPLPAKAFDREGLVLHCSSFSKCLAPGYRVGWVAPGRFATALARNKITTSLTTAVPTQAAIANYLEHGGYDRHLRKLRGELCARQQQHALAVARHFPPGTRATRPAGGYFMWIELQPGVDTLLLQKQAMAMGISVAPGPIFSAQRAFRNCLRLNFGHPFDARADAAMASLGKLIAGQRA